MKKLINLSFALVVSYSGLAQLPDIKFSTYTPRWYQIIEDTNFVPGQVETINSFNSVYPFFRPEMEEQFSYVPFQCTNNNNQPNGSVILKLRNNDGQVLWINYLNSYNNDLQHFNTGFGVNDHIYFCAKIRTQQSFNLNENWQFGGHFKHSVRIIDKQSGSFIENIFDPDDSIGVSEFFPKSNFLSFNNKFKKIDYVEEGVYVANVNQLTLAPIDSQLLRFPTIDLINTFKARGLFIQANDQNAILFTRIVSKDTSILKHYGNLAIYKIDNDTFVLNKTVDFSHLIKMVHTSGTLDRIYFHFSDNGDLVMTQTYSSNVFPRDRSWLMKVNNEGKIVQYIEDIKLSNHYYLFNIPFYMDDENILMLSFQSASSERGYDILQLTKAGDIIPIGQLTTGNQLRWGLGGINMNQSGDIILSGQWDQKYAVVMGMHISDFDLQVSTTEVDPIEPKSLMTIVPNPTHNYFKISCSDHSFDTGTVYIRDIQGRNYYSNRCAVGDMIDIQHLPPGMYIVHFNPDQRPGYYLTSKLIKN